MRGKANIISGARLANFQIHKFKKKETFSNLCCINEKKILKNKISRKNQKYKIK